MNNRDLFDSMVKYKHNVDLYKLDPVGKSKPKIPDYVGTCIMKISEKMSTKFNFCSYSYRDEMVGDGIENCIRYIDNFNPEKSNNPFAYFTQIVKFCFIRRIQKEKKQQYIKYKNLQNLFTEEDLIENGAVSRNGTFHGNITDFVKKYEEVLQTKKDEKKKGLEIFIENE